MRIEWARQDYWDRVLKRPRRRLLALNLTERRTLERAARIAAQAREVLREAHGDAPENVSLTAEDLDTSLAHVEHDGRDLAGAEYWDIGDARGRL